LPDKAIARIGTTRYRYTGHIKSLAFTADAKRLLSFGSDGGIGIWDAATGRELRHLAAEPRANPDWVAFSADGKLAAAMRYGPIESPILVDWGATLWDLTTGKWAKTLALGPMDWRPYYWDDTGKKVMDATPLGGHLKHFGCLAADGRVLALVFGNTVGTWDVATGKQLARWHKPIEKQHLNPGITQAPGSTQPVFIDFLAITGDGRMLMTHDPIRHVELWEAATGKMLRHPPGIESPLALSADGKKIACDRTPGVCICDAADGKVLRQLQPPKDPMFTWHPAQENAWNGHFSFSQDGAVLANGKGGLWDVTTGKALPRPAALHPTAMAFSPDGKMVAVAAQTRGDLGANPGVQAGVIQLHDLASGKELPLTAGLPMPVVKAALTPDGKTLATAYRWQQAEPSYTSYTRIVLWDAATGEQRQPLDANKTWTNFSPGVFFPDDHTLFFIDGDALYPSEVATGRQLPKLKLVVPTWSSPLAISPDGKWLAVWSRGVGPVPPEAVQVIDTTTGKSICDIDPSIRTAGATFLPDGRSLVVCAAGQAHVWDVPTGRETRRIKFGESPVVDWSPPPTAVFSPDGRRIAFRENGQIAVHELAGGTEVCRSEKLAQVVHCLALSPDGRTVAWGSQADPLVHLLDVATGKERHAFAGHESGIVSLIFSADGKTLVSGSNDTTLLVWDLTAR
jgi:WD40 repeat protein